MMEEIKAMNDDEMEQAAGGFFHCPTNEQLQQMGLWEYVRNAETGAFDCFYDTKRGENEWKHVGSGDMLKYVERTLGADDARYKMLRKIIS